MDALAVTAFTQLDRSLGMLHSAKIPFLWSPGTGSIVLRARSQRPAEFDPQKSSA
jgi:hypothetical protein